MAEVFPVTVGFGVKVSLSLDQEIVQTTQGLDVLNVDRIQPRLEFDITRKKLTEAEKATLEQFFIDRSGDEEVFLFEDYSDNTATNIDEDNNNDRYPTIAGYERGKTYGEVIATADGSLRLAKVYFLSVGSAAFRVITRPKVVTVYDSMGVAYSPQPTVNMDTGVVTGTVAAGDRWSGAFYVPVRIDGDEETFKKVGNREYSFQKRIIEVKESTANTLIPTAFTYDNPEYFSLFFNYGSEANKQLKTDTLKFDNQFEARKQQYNTVEYLQERLIMINNKVLSYSDIQYLITLYRSMIGSYGIFRAYFWDVESGTEPTHPVRFEKGIDYSIVSENNNFAYLVFQVDQLTLKKAKVEGEGTLVTDLVRCWDVERNDGFVARFTDFDQDLTINGNIYKAFPSLIGKAYTNNNDLDTKNSELSGVFDLQITESDLLAGRYDNQKVRIFLANWIPQTEFATTFNGYVGNRTVYYLEGQYRKYTIETVSLERDLNRSQPFFTSYRCRHKFLSQGYGNCNLQTTPQSEPSTSNTNIQIRTTVATAPDDKNITTNTTQNWSPYSFGTILFETGKLSGQEFEIKSAFGTGLTVSPAFAVLPSVGDQILVTKRCDKDIDGGCTTFGNQVNYGGQPRVPGGKTLISNPQ